MKKNTQKPTDSGLLFICLIITVVIALGLGLVFGAGATENPIESLMLFIQDSLKGDEPDVTGPTVIVPDLPVVTPPLDDTTVDGTNPPPEPPQPSDSTDESTDNGSTPPITTPPPETTSPYDDPDYFKDALFIGDSRTVGFWLYARIPDATYFGRTSMTVFNMFASDKSETGTGEQSLTTLLQSKQFGKIYILLGINDIGYNMDSVISTYSTVIGYLKAYQPDAKIILQSNMHVTAAKSAQNSYGINNKNIDLLNSRIATLADNQSVFYLGFEHLFDDASGNLIAEYSWDGVHFYAKPYSIWRDYILSEGRK